MDTDRKRYYAQKAHEENEKGAARYFDLIRGGVSGEEARAIVQDAFGWSDFRLDKVLSTRASAFGPGTIAELEAVAVMAIRRAEIAAAAESRFYYEQLGDLRDREAAGESHYEVKYTEGFSGKLGKTYKSERIPIREAQALLLQKVTEAAAKPILLIKSMGGQIIINNISGFSELSHFSAREIESQIEQAKLERGLEVAHTVQGGEN